MSTVEGSSTREAVVAMIEQHVRLLNEGDVTGYMRMYSEDCVFHGYPPQFSPDHAGATRFYAALVAAFPDAHVAPEDVVVEGDRVAVRYTLSGTHAGDFLGAPATGNAVEIEGITTLHLRGGQIVERWNRLDEVGLLTAIGALPSVPEQEKSG